MTVELTVKCVASVIARTTGPGGFEVTPETPMPTARPAVLAQMMVGLVVNEQPVSVTPAAVRDKAEPVPVAAVLMTKVVVLVTELIVAVPGIFVPLMLMPGISPVVLAQVTVTEAFVVAQLVRTMAEV